MIAIERSGCRHQRLRRSRQAREKLRDGAVKGSRLMQVGSVPGIVDRHSRRTRDLACHVVGCSEKMRVVGADQHQGRHGDLVEPGDDTVVGLGQHAACRTGEAPRRAMLAGADLVALTECDKPPRFEVPRPLLRPLVHARLASGCESQAPCRTASAR